MPSQNNNGRRRVAIIGICVTVGLLISLAVVSWLWAGIANNSEAIRKSDVMQATMIERLTGIQKDIGEVKTDVKELRRDVADLAKEQ